MSTRRHWTADEGIELIPERPDRDIHVYRISQLFSLKGDPGEILREYRTTRYPERFYNLKIRRLLPGMSQTGNST